MRQSAVQLQRLATTDDVAASLRLGLARPHGGDGLLPGFAA